jgi:hypothetical protein
MKLTSNSVSTKIARFAKCSKLLKLKKKKQFIGLLQLDLDRHETPDDTCGVQVLSKADTVKPH